MTKLDIIREFELKSPATKTKVLKYIKSMLKLEGCVRPNDDKVYHEVVNSYTTWKNNK